MSRLRVKEKYTKYFDKLDTNDVVGVFNWPDGMAIKRTLQNTDKKEIVCAPIKYNTFVLARKQGPLKRKYKDKKYSIYEW